MAILISNTVTGGLTSNFSSGISTANALQITGTTTAALTASFVTHTAFAGGGETLEAVGLEVVAVGDLTNVTTTLRLTNATDAVNTDYVYTGNLLTTGGRGWNFFRLGTGQVLTAGKNWQVQVAANIGSRISLLRTATAGDWNRIFVASGNFSPISGDSLYIGGRLETTGAFPATGRVTQSSIAIDSSLNLQNFSVVNGGTARWTGDGYTMGVSGNLLVTNGGTFNIGASGSGVSGRIEFVNTTAGQNFLGVYGPCDFNIYGNDVASEYNLYLSGTANAGQALATISGTGSLPSGWVSGRSILYTSTRGYGNTDVRTINSVSSRTITNSSNFTYTHDVRSFGTQVPIPDIARACMLDRGFVIGNRSTSAGSWFMGLFNTARCNFTNTFFRNQGAAVAAAGLLPSKYGIVTELIDGGILNFDNCSFSGSATNPGIAIYGEGNSTRLNPDINIKNSTMVFGGGGNVTYVIAPSLGVGKTFLLENCIVALTSTSTSSPFLIYSTDRPYHAGNVTTKNCEIYGIPSTFFSQHASTVGTALGNVLFQDTKIFTCGSCLNLANHHINNSVYSIGNITIDGCSFLGRIANGNFFYPNNLGYIFTPIYIKNCKVNGVAYPFYYFTRYMRGVYVDNCSFEDDAGVTPVNFLTTQSNSPINKGYFNNCSIYSNATNIYNNTNTSSAFQGDGEFYFKNTYFNKTLNNFMSQTNMRFLGDYKFGFDNCTFSGDATYNGSLTRMCRAVESSVSEIAGGTSILISPSGNQTGLPMTYDIILPTLSTNSNVTFKTRSSGLNATLTGRVVNKFGTISETGLTISSNWDAQTLALPTGTYNDLVKLQFTTIATTGSFFIDQVTVSSSGVGLVDTSAIYLQTSSTGGGGTGSSPAPSSYLFC